jgi:NAD/NADP transhydrogenase alpha subunit
VRASSSFELETEATREDKGGYAKAQSEDFYAEASAPSCSPST